MIASFVSANQFQYLMKLHYSQTGVVLSVILGIVSVPYEITLLSNSIILRLTKF